MRSEQEMFALILSVAANDERVRAVAMNGSRTNPNAPRDAFQDYDIVYLVTEMDSFLRDPAWIRVFGEIMVMQLPDDSSIYPAEDSSRYAYLMQFLDGNRIDLTLLPVSRLDSYLQEDTLTVVLLDKDHCISPLPEPTDRIYHVKRPSARNFFDCCDEFWWVSPYVAKGLCRRELLYAADHLSIVREELIRMLSWYVGIQTDFSVSIGKNGKYLERYLPENWWNRLTATYRADSYAACWQSLFSVQQLFRETAQTVAASLGFSNYPQQYDDNVTAYLHRLLKEYPAE